MTYTDPGNDVPSAVNYFDLVAACGGESLHPGGKEATNQLIRMCGIEPGMAILEAGCGSGYTSAHLAVEHQCRVHGIDLNPVMILRARERVADLPQETRPVFQQADARAIPFPAACFARVLCEGCTSFMPDKPKVAREYFRVLQPGGMLGELEFYYRRPPPVELVTQLNRALPGYHLENWTAEEWIALYRKAGFEPVGAVDHGYGAFPEHQLQSSTERFIRFYAEHPVPGLPSDPARLREYFQFYQALFNRNREYLGYRLYAFRKP